jgi:hypothetical protein
MRLTFRELGDELMRLSERRSIGAQRPEDRYARRSGRNATSSPRRVPSVGRGALPAFPRNASARQVTGDGGAWARGPQASGEHFGHDHEKPPERSQRATLLTVKSQRNQGAFTTNYPRYQSSNSVFATTSVFPLSEKPKPRIGGSRSLASIVAFAESSRSGADGGHRTAQSFGQFGDARCTTQPSCDIVRSPPPHNPASGMRCPASGPMPLA